MYAEIIEKIARLQSEAFYLSIEIEVFTSLSCNIKRPFPVSFFYTPQGGTELSDRFSGVRY